MREATLCGTLCSDYVARNGDRPTRRYPLPIDLILRSDLARYLIDKPGGKLNFVGQIQLESASNVIKREKKTSIKVRELTKDLCLN